MAFTAKVRSKYTVSGRGFVLVVDYIEGTPLAGDVLNEFRHCRILSTFNEKVIGSSTNKKRPPIYSCELMIVGHGRDKIDVGDIISGDAR